MATEKKRNVGITFLSDLIKQQEAAESAPKEQEATTPIPVPEPVVEQPTVDIPAMLQKAGFEGDEEDTKNFIDNNTDEEGNINLETPSFTSLKSKNDPVKVKGVKDVVLDSILQTPFFAVAKGLVKPLEIVSEGLKRFEASKTRFLQQRPDLIPEALAGGGETKFPEASLRAGDQPELGDFFRELGLPEVISAAGGLGLDILTDIPVTGGIGAIGKQLKVAERLNTLRSTEFVKIVENALKGRGRFDDLPPVVKQSLRASRGEAEKASVEAASIANTVYKLHPENDEVVDLANRALKGDKYAAVALPDDIKTLVNDGRKIIDTESLKLADELEAIFQQDPVRFGKLAEKFGVKEGSKIDLSTLKDIITQNIGQYTKRSYMMYVDKNYKPTAEVTQRAIQGLVQDEVVENSEKAKALLDSIIRDKSFTFNTPELGRLSVNQDSFIARQRIPEYLRDYMGEIKDFRYNLINTTRNVAEARSQFQFFKNMRNAGLFSEVPTNNHFIKVPSGGALAWGLIDGMYTSKEVASLLKGVKQAGDVADQTITNTMRVLKGIKTVFNPKTHAHNMMGNIGWFSQLAGVPIQSHAHRYIGKGSDNALKIWLSAMKTIEGGTLPKALQPLEKVVGGVEAGRHTKEFKNYLEMIENGVVGNELPNADQILWLERLVKQQGVPKELPKAFKTAHDAAKWTANAYSFEDQFFKMASYLEYTRGRKMSPKAATEELYKWFPNYFEASQLSDLARNTPGGLLLANPFATFRTEAHRIMLNAMKDSNRTRLITGLFFGGRMAANTAILASMGLGAKEVSEFFLTRPETASELLLNPADPNFDLNFKYLDPFNTHGLFAPVMWAAGSTGSNPFDYILDFTTFSPEFGYSNLLINALEPALTGKGRYGEELSFNDRISGLVKGVAPTSFGVDLPKALDPKQETDERIRRSLRFFGVDVEKRNPDYVKTKVKSRLKDKMAKGQPTQNTLTAAQALGVDVGKMKQPKKEDAKRRTSGLDKFIDSLGL